VTQLISASSQFGGSGCKAFEMAEAMFSRVGGTYVNAGSSGSSSSSSSTSRGVTSSSNRSRFNYGTGRAATYGMSADVFNMSLQDGRSIK
jgi:hypothetical protein